MLRVKANEGSDAVVAGRTVGYVSSRVLNENRAYFPTEVLRKRAESRQVVFALRWVASAVRVLGDAEEASP